MVLVHQAASLMEGMLLVKNANFLLSTIGGMTIHMYQQVLFDGSQMKLSLTAALIIEMVESYGVQPK